MIYFYFIIDFNFLYVEMAALQKHYDEAPYYCGDQVAIGRLKHNKAARTDGILSELLMYGAEEIASVLRTLLVQMEYQQNSQWLEIGTNLNLQERRP